MFYIAQMCTVFIGVECYTKLVGKPVVLIGLMSLLVSLYWFGLSWTSWDIVLR